MITEQLDFTGRVAIVTGGGTGIGKATAIQLARLGADVVIASRTVAELEAAAEEVRAASGRRCVAVPTNIRKEEQVAALVQRTVDEFGRIDVLVNNAGGTRMTPLEDIDTHAWQTVYDLNITSAFWMTREAGRHMIKQRSGAIVNVSSGAGVHGVKGGTHYSSSKAALQMFTITTAAEWGRFNIRCNCVAPGLVASARSVAAWEAAKLPEEMMGKNIPLHRIGTPDEQANAIVFLASDAASYITGQVLPVNGGPVISGIDLD